MKVEVTEAQVEFRQTPERQPEIIHWRIGDIEFRQTPERQPEIIHWKKDSTGKEYCYTLMFFEKDKEGFYVRFVGGRPLQYDNPMSLWGLMNYSQRVLDAAFDLQRDI